MVGRCVGADPSCAHATVGDVEMYDGCVALGQAPPMIGGLELLDVVAGDVRGQRLPGLEALGTGRAGQLKGVAAAGDVLLR